MRLHGVEDGMIERNAVSRFERCFVVLSLLFMSNSLFGLMWPDYGIDPILAGDAGNPAFQASFMLIYAVVAGLIAIRPAGFLQLCTQNASMLLLVGFAVLSVAWSVNPEITLRRSAALIGTTAFSLYVVARFSSGEFLRLLAIAIGIAAAMTPLFVLVMPTVAVHSETLENLEGAWRGMFLHKNQLGLTMALGILVLSAVVRDRAARRWPAIIGIGLCALSLVMSKSATALVVVILVPLILWVVAWLRRLHPNSRIQTVALAGAVVSISSVLVFASISDIFSLLQRDSTMTGRTLLWSGAVDFGLERPLLGYGYKAFWSGYPRSVIESIAGWVGTQGHNGYLDLWLELGAGGVFLFLMTLISGARRIARGHIWLIESHAIYYLGFLIYFLLVSIPHSQILQYNGVDWVVYVATLGYLSPFAITRSAMQMPLGPRDVPAVEGGRL